MAAPDASRPVRNSLGAKWLVLPAVWVERGTVTTPPVDWPSKFPRAYQPRQIHAKPSKLRRTCMTLIDIPRLLGERSPTASRVRVTIRNKLLLRRALARTDHQGI